MVTDARGFGNKNNLSARYAFMKKALAFITSRVLVAALPEEEQHGDHTDPRHRGE